MDREDREVRLILDLKMSILGKSVSQSSCSCSKKVFERDFFHINGIWREWR